MLLIIKWQILRHSRKPPCLFDQILLLFLLFKNTVLKFPFLSPQQLPSSVHGNASPPSNVTTRYKTISLSILLSVSLRVKTLVLPTWSLQLFTINLFFSSSSEGIFHILFDCPFLITHERSTLFSKLSCFGYSSPDKFFLNSHPLVIILVTNFLLNIVKSLIL